MARYNPASSIALGGILAALAVVILCMGTMIPVATFVCPMLCMLVLKLICRLFGNRIGWAWYGCVALLAMLLGPDKEAAAIFLFLGYYPIVKPWLDGRKLAFLWKLLLFNVSIFALYGLLIYVLGLDGVVEDFKAAGLVLTVITLLLGNICLFLLDMLLGIMAKRKKK